MALGGVGDGLGLDCRESFGCITRVVVVSSPPSMKLSLSLVVMMMDL